MKKKLLFILLALMALCPVAFTQNVRFYMEAVVPRENLKTQPEKNTAQANLCPTPIWDASPSKTVACNAGCVLLDVRDSVPGLGDYMEPAGLLIVQTDMNLWTENKLEVYLDGSFVLRIASSNTGTGTPTNYWNWNATPAGAIFS